MKKIFLLLVCSALLLAVFSCRKKQNENSKTVIAIIPKGTTHEYWKSVHAGAIKASQELGVELIWKGPLREDDRESQISIVEDLVNRSVKGIVLAPLDDIALRTPVTNATQAGIPVVIIDSDLKGDDYISFVATDNYLGGKMAARCMVDLLKGKGKVAVLRCHEGSASTSKREQGFLDEIASAKGIQVVSSNQYGGATIETAYQASENLLAPYKTSSNTIGIDGIFCPNESTTFGMLRALQDGGFAGHVRFIGFDSSTKLVEAMEKNQIDALIIQSPFKMGYVGVKTMVAHLKGEPVEKKIDTGVTLVTKANMNNPDVHGLLQPDLSQWLQ
jgi:ribose transport system substrate-binding protein